jgi:hypothetical protein
MHERRSRVSGRFWYTGNHEKNAVVLASTASAAFLGGNLPLDASSLQRRIEQIAGELSREQLPCWSRAWLRRAAQLCVAPIASLRARGVETGTQLVIGVVTGALRGTPYITLDRVGGFLVGWAHGSLAWVSSAVRERRQLRQHERTGRVLGDEKFQRRLEKNLGRFLRRRKPGPKKSQAHKHSN